MSSYSSLVQYEISYFSLFGGRKICKRHFNIFYFLIAPKSWLKQGKLNLVLCSSWKDNNHFQLPGGLKSSHSGKTDKLYLNCHFLLQQKFFPDPGQILYHLSHQGSPSSVPKSLNISLWTENFKSGSQNCITIRAILFTMSPKASYLAPWAMVLKVKGLN